MQNDKLPPAPIFNPRKRLRKAIVADPNADLESQGTGWSSSFENDINYSNEIGGRISDQQCYPQQKSIAAPGSYSATFTSGQQRPSNQKISPRLPGQINNNNNNNNYSINNNNINNNNNSMTVNRREYVGQSNNPGATTSYSRTLPAKPNPQGFHPMPNQRTFTASKSSTTNVMATTMTSDHTNQNRSSNTDNKMGYAQASWNPTNRVKTRAPQPYQPTSCRQLLGGESAHSMVNLPEADPAPGYAISPQDGQHMEAAESKVKPTTGKSESQAKKSTPGDVMSPLISTTIQQLKQVYSKYKSKFNMIFEVYGILDSAVHPNLARTGKQFILRDETDRIECAFYEIDRNLPRLTRGHWHRCIGLADKEKGKLLCVSVRPASLEERRAVQVLAPILDLHLQTMEQKASNF